MKIRLFVHDDSEERLLSSVTSVSDDFFDGFENEEGQIKLMKSILEAWLTSFQSETIIGGLANGVYSFGFEEAEENTPIEFDWTKKVEIGTLSFGEVRVVATGPPGFLDRHEERYPVTR